MAEIAKDEMELVKDMVAKSGFETAGKHTFNNGVLTVDNTPVNPPAVNPDPINPPAVAVTPPAVKKDEPVANTPPAEPIKVEPVVDPIAAAPIKENETPAPNHQPGHD